MLGKPRATGPRSCAMSSRFSPVVRSLKKIPRAIVVDGDQLAKLKLGGPALVLLGAVIAGIRRFVGRRSG